MIDYSEIENLSNKLILEQYEDTILTAETTYYECLCTCVDGYRETYTCRNSNGICPAAGYRVRAGSSSRCATRICPDHGGAGDFYYQTGYCWRE